MVLAIYHKTFVSLLRWYKEVSHFIFVTIYIVSWAPEGRYCSSKMFRWEPEGRYCHWLCTAIYSALLVLNGTSLSCNNALLALNWRYIFYSLYQDFRSIIENNWRRRKKRTLSSTFVCSRFNEKSIREMDKSSD